VHVINSLSSQGKGKGTIVANPMVLKVFAARKAVGEENGGDQSDFFVVACQLN